MNPVFDYSELHEFKESTSMHPEIKFPYREMSTREDFIKNNNLRCRYCGTPMEIEGFVSKQTAFSSGLGKFILDCNNCGWWMAQKTQMNFIEETDIRFEYNVYEGILKKYDIASLDVPVQTLRRYLVQHPRMLHHINPTKLEILVGSVFKDFYDCEAIHLGKTGDGGIDLVLIRGRKKFLVQVKRRSKEDHTEGPSAIRELIGVMSIKGEKRGIFVSTADHYSPTTIKEVGILNRKPFGSSVELVDFAKIVELLDITKTDIKPSWREHLKDFKI